MAFAASVFVSIMISQIFMYACTKFYPNWMKNVINMDKISFVPSSIAVTALIFMEYTTANQYYMRIQCMKFHLGWSINTERAGMNLLMPLRKIQLSVSWCLLDSL